MKVFAASRGLRRVGAETETKTQPPSRARTNSKPAGSAVSASLNKNDVKKAMATSANDTTLEEIVNMEESMSTSLEEALFYKPRSKTRKSEEKITTTAEEIGHEADDEKVEEVPVIRGISMKDFQSHQKIMEEQNKQKKNMLYKAIEQQ